MEAALHAQEKDYYAAQCRLMQESLEQMRSLRHDMLTHMSAVENDGQMDISHDDATFTVRVFLYER